MFGGERALHILLFERWQSGRQVRGGECDGLLRTGLQRHQKNDVFQIAHFRTEHLIFWVHKCVKCVRNVEHAKNMPRTICTLLAVHKFSVVWHFTASAEATRYVTNLSKMAAGANNDRATVNVAALYRYILHSTPACTDTAVRPLLSVMFGGSVMILITLEYWRTVVSASLLQCF